MKKILVTLLALFLAGTSYAQDNGPRGPRPDNGFGQQPPMHQDAWPGGLGGPGRPGGARPDVQGRPDGPRPDMKGKPNGPRPDFQGNQDRQHGPDFGHDGRRQHNGGNWGRGPRGNGQRHGYDDHGPRNGHRNGWNN